MWAAADGWVHAVATRDLVRVGFFREPDAIGRVTLAAPISWRLRLKRIFLVPVIAALLSGAAVAGIISLQQRFQASSRAQTSLQAMRRQLAQLQGLPWLASPRTGIPLPASPALMHGLERTINSSVGTLLREGAPQGLAQVRTALEANYAGLNAIYRAGVATRWRDAATTARLAATAQRYNVQVDDAMVSAGTVYGRRASQAEWQGASGTAAAILVLLMGFIWFFRGSAKAHSAQRALAQENARLLALSIEAATTDVLTGLRNRRCLLQDAEAAIVAATSASVLLLILFDLDGFKNYNDTFGHPAGDALLARLAARLGRSLPADAVAYRIGGDEFCVLAKAEYVDQVISQTTAALSEEGEGFSVASSSGYALVPSEAATLAHALHLADERLYTNKRSSRQSATAQARDALIQVLMERDPGLGTHVSAVAESSARTARQLGLSKEDIEHVRLAGELHDIGKAAIPDSILNKPGKLDEQEWEFIRQHTLIGERILAAAPALASIAVLVRASHERIDGNGYPDGLTGTAIPIGARIIAVADAYETMTSGRSYHKARSTTAAIAELRRCAGSQFDPDVIEGFIAILRENSTEISTLLSLVA